MKRLGLPILVMLAVVATFPATASAGGVQTLDVTKGGAGHGTVVSDVQPGISCGSTCSNTFVFGTVVTLTASAANNSTFTGWTGDCSGAGTCQVTMDQARSVGATFESYRPDAWIKLCGQSTGCTIDPPPHPWLGRNIYNTTGRHQTIRQAIDNGEGVRYWIMVENDGATADTVTVQGCRGNRYFVVNHVTLGRQKRPDAGATEVTRRFKAGTLSFSFPPNTNKQYEVFTLNVVTSNAAVGVSYRCEMTMTSSGDPSKADTVVAKMSGF